MYESILTNYYDVKPEGKLQTKGYDSYYAQGKLYTVVTVTNVEEEVLIELYEMSEQLKRTGDGLVSTFLLSKEETFLITHKEVDYVVLVRNRIDWPSINRTGRKLAKFHMRGRAIERQIDRMSRMGLWKDLWEKRLLQMEKVWTEQSTVLHDNEFDQTFVQTFPYFLGVAENAIQYVVDTELDEEPDEEDAGTICHDRFYPGMWDGEGSLKIPFDWVFDHATRDLAEWIRWTYEEKQRAGIPDIQRFLRDYQTVQPLTPFSWRMLYGRLLFPLHYMECVEKYYLSGHDGIKRGLGDQLPTIVKHTREYERFLDAFYQIAEAPVSQAGLPSVNWLTLS
ncbi:spore coat protein YutH [Mangrovibacillus cuniculi]|uniref:Spore coat protein YutH n=2 Tax=Mangrovibacillus cuniculi TaxID=2593652 RepID=A0A7S8CEE6_9BACI|nr:spore coat protein YutH [Mangrovibacillus cuniculi]